MATNPAKDPYQILGVAKSATQNEIKSTYRKLAKSLHPDLNPGNKTAEQKFKDVASAYEVLGDEKQRKLYDEEKLESGPFANARASFGAGAGAYAGGAGPRHYYYETQEPGADGTYSEAFSFEDLFGDVFEQARKRGRAGAGHSHGPTGGPSRGPLRGQDELYRMEVSLNDILGGAEREITLPNGKRLRVKIPAGVTDGTRLRFAAQGSPGLQGGPSGDAFVELSIRPSKLFRREGTSLDLELELPITLAEAVAGAEIKVPTLDGNVMLKIPAGVNSGSRLRIRGKGIPARGKPNERGDLYAVLKVTLPPVVDDELKKAIVDAAARNPYDPRTELGQAA